MSSSCGQAWLKLHPVLGVERDLPRHPLHRAIHPAVARGFFLIVIEGVDLELVFDWLLLLDGLGAAELRLAPAVSESVVSSSSLRAARAVGVKRRLGWQWQRTPVVGAASVGCVWHGGGRTRSWNRAILVVARLLRADRR